jgi:hypothetical protein
MLTRIILDFDTQPESIDYDSLFSYHGYKDLSTVTSLEAIADTREKSLSYLGDFVPNLQKLRLNNSKISSIRDIGCRLTSLRFLSLANCNLTSLNGVSTLSQNLEELHLAFNAITDVSDLMGMDKLKVLDLEGGQISDLTNLRFLICCTSLTSLTLAGNPAVRNFESYARAVSELVPNLVYLDERRIRGRKKIVVEKLENWVPIAPPTEEPGGPRIRRRSAAGFENEDGIGEGDGPITEMITDKAEERPPSARGVSIRNRLRDCQGGFGKQMAIKIVRPRSARPRTNKT